MRGPVVIALLAIIAVAACSARLAPLPPASPGPSDPPAEAPPPEPLEDRAVDGPYELVFAVAADRAAAGAPIEAWTRLTYDGPAAEIVLVGSGSGLIGYGARRIDGEQSMGGLMTADCAPRRVRAREPMDERFKKGAAWSEDDPNAAFYRDWVQGPELWLPAGTWELTATATFTEHECGGRQVGLATSVVIEVR